ncbi:MAG: hypothetical protein ACFCVA_15460 [Gammaproteobacteria bacterium]
MNLRLGIALMTALALTAGNAVLARDVENIPRCPPIGFALHECAGVAATCHDISRGYAEEVRACVEAANGDSAELSECREQARTQREEAKSCRDEVRQCLSQARQLPDTP